MTKPFELTGVAIDVDGLRAAFDDPSCGAYTSFEGRVRDHNDGRRVLRLEYEAYAPLAVAEGTRILEEARARFAVTRLACVHRTGALAIGDVAVWVGAWSAHRDAAFVACRYVIDEVKARVPIWKKEHYVDGSSGWVACEACATGHDHAGDARHSHAGAADGGRARSDATRRRG
jgi:molybdopterin synthase catalytic subunit